MARAVKADEAELRHFQMTRGAERICKPDGTPALQNYVTASWTFEGRERRLFCSSPSSSVLRLLETIPTHGNNNPNRVFCSWWFDPKFPFLRFDEIDGFLLSDLPMLSLMSTHMSDSLMWILAIAFVDAFDLTSLGRCRGSHLRLL
jgi:hypothetical protein